MPSLGLVLATLVGGTLAAGSANALNCYYDRDIDVRHAPHRAPSAGAAHRARRSTRWSSGSCSACWPSSCSALTTNLLSAVLAVAAIAFYVVVYTMLLKRRTSQNIVWGGAAGCMPVLIGWSAVTGTRRRGPRSCCSWSSSSGRRRTSGRWRCASATTTPRPPCRCCRSSRRPRSWPSRIVGLLLGDGRHLAAARRAGRPVRRRLRRRAPCVLGAAFLREAHLLQRRVRRGGDASADAAVPLVDHLPGAAVPRRRRRPLL